MAIEETGTSQWLYTELKGCVDTILIRDSHRNKLLNEDAPTETIAQTTLKGDDL